jgi:hypothetical protein
VKIPAARRFAFYQASGEAQGRPASPPRMKYAQEAMKNFFSPLPTILRLTVAIILPARAVVIPGGESGETKKGLSGG